MSTNTHAEAHDDSLRLDENTVDENALLSPPATPDYWQAHIDAIQAVTAQVKTHFGSLHAEQLNFKPSASEWSVAQCLEHLMLINRSYFPIFEAIAADQKEWSFWEGLPFLPHFFGTKLLAQLGSPQKLHAPQAMQPSNSRIDADIVTQFVEHQSQLVQHLAILNTVQHHKIILTSPVAGLVTYELNHAAAIIALHEQRHYQQALRLTQLAAFAALPEPNPSDLTPQQEDSSTT